MEKSLTLGQRLLALALNTTIFYLIYAFLLGSWGIKDGGMLAWLYSGIGLWVFSLLATPWFVPPKDSIGIAITSALTLLVLHFTKETDINSALNYARWFAIALCVIVIALSAYAIINHDKGERGNSAVITYTISRQLGRGEVLFTLPALISIGGFYQDEVVSMLILLFLWVVFVTIKPVELIISVIQTILENKTPQAELSSLGVIERIDDPNIIRVTLEKNATWDSNGVCIVNLYDEGPKYVLPLFVQMRENERFATGICHRKPEKEIKNLVHGHVYKCTDGMTRNELIKEISGVDEETEIVGFVVEGSSIENINFEVTKTTEFEEGMVVFANISGKSIFYQILNAQTMEENFQRNPRGTHIVTAAQLGEFDSEKGFTKYAWLPSMNQPILKMKNNVAKEQIKLSGEVSIGRVPYTNIDLQVNISDLVEYHTAILGTTGTGKTELALSVIRDALNEGIKVFCVDFTEEYAKRLSDENITKLGMSAANEKELNDKVLDVVGGTFGAPEEKRRLIEFMDGIRGEIDTAINDFLMCKSSNLGIFELTEITNTRATLLITEAYLSALMRWAKRNRKREKILIVLEEAHTIIPENSWGGFDNDTQWVVNRIGQIALQGRKYGVGLMVISQRTALVSKTILSQCNTYFTHSLIDQTSLTYLSSIYSSLHTKIVPNLRFLEFIAYGKAVKSERPMLVKREFSDDIEKESKKLDYNKNDSENVGDVASED